MGHLSSPGPCNLRYESKQTTPPGNSNTIYSDELASVFHISAPNIFGEFSSVEEVREFTNSPIEISWVNSENLAKLTKFIQF